MTRLPRITSSELTRALRRAGWREEHQTGSHLIFTHPDRRGIVVVPIHAGRTIRLGTLKSILDSAGISTDDLIRLL